MRKGFLTVLGVMMLVTGNARAQDSSPGRPCSTVSTQDAVAAALGQPGTRVLFGDSNLDYGVFSGIRIAAGINLCSGLGLEGGYFGLERQSSNFNAASDPNGNPLLGRPFFDTFNNLENNFRTSNPDPATGPWAGATSIASHTRFQGYEINL